MEKETAVKDNKDEGRFEMALGNETAFIEYAETGGGALALTHTEVPAQFEGRGVGARLVKGTLEIVRAQGLKIVPRCSFVAAYVQRYPEYQQLVAQESRRELAAVLKESHLKNQT